MKLLETKRGNMWIGAGLYYYGRAMFYLSMVNFIMVAATFWHTTFSQKYDISLIEFIILGSLVFIGVILIDHYYLTPGLMAYSNKVMKEQNPVLEQIAELRNELKELRNR